MTAASLAEEPPVTIGVDDPVDHVWQVMAGQRVWLLPVLDGRRLVGVVIHYADIAATSGSAAPRRPATSVSVSPLLSGNPGNGPSLLAMMETRLTLANTESTGGGPSQMAATP